MRRAVEYIGAHIIVPISLGSWRFAPSPLLTLLAIALIAALISLGRWQLHRADEKRALYAAFAAGTDATRVLDAHTPRLPRYQHVAATGRYDAARQILIDNMIDARGRAGYYVITPFALADGAWVLVNRGWVPLGASRARKPGIAVGAEARTLHGRADNLPVAGLKMGENAPLAPPYPVVANFPTQPQIARLLGEPTLAGAAEIVLLDAEEPDGYQRQWQAPGMPPLRHVAYAVQWFGLALALSVIYVVTNLKRAPRPRACP